MVGERKDRTGTKDNSRRTTLRILEQRKEMHLEDLALLQPLHGDMLQYMYM